MRDPTGNQIHFIELQFSDYYRFIYAGLLTCQYPCVSDVKRLERLDSQIVAESVLGGLHRAYRFAA